MVRQYTKVGNGLLRTGLPHLFVHVWPFVTYLITKKALSEAISLPANSIRKETHVITTLPFTLAFRDSIYANTHSFIITTLHFLYNSFLSRDSLTSCSQTKRTYALRIILTCTHACIRAHTHADTCLPSSINFTL